MMQTGIILSIIESVFVFQGPPRQELVCFENVQMHFQQRRFPSMVVVGTLDTRAPLRNVPGPCWDGKCHTPGQIGKEIRWCAPHPCNPFDGRSRVVCRARGITLLRCAAPNNIRRRRDRKTPATPRRRSRAARGQPGR